MAGCGAVDVGAYRRPAPRATGRRGRTALAIWERRKERKLVVKRNRAAVLTCPTTSRRGTARLSKKRTRTVDLVKELVDVARTRALIRRGKCSHSSRGNRIALPDSLTYRAVVHRVPGTGGSKRNRF